MGKFSSPFMAKSPLHDNHDEPPVVREELDKKGKDIYDKLRIENARLLELGFTQEQINAKRLKEHKEKKKKQKKKKEQK